MFKATGRVFHIGTQQRSDSTFRLACALALSGRLGNLREIHVSVPAGRAGPGSVIFCSAIRSAGRW